MGLAAGSSSYFIFVAAVFFVYWLSPQTRLLRLAIILLANYYFTPPYHRFTVEEGENLLALVIFLVTAENELATTYIIGRVGNGDYGVALAYCTVLIVTMSLAIALIQALVGERQLGRRAIAT